MNDSSEIEIHVEANYLAATQLNLIWWDEAITLFPGERRGVFCLFVSGRSTWNGRAELVAI
jgi:hypothetical protein